MFKALWECISGPRDEASLLLAVGEGPGKAEDPRDHEKDVQLAHEILAAMQSAEKTGEDLRMRVGDVVSDTSWTESLAKAVLGALDAELKEGLGMKKEGPLKDAIEKAIKAAVGFARDHPVWTTLIALGVLAVLMPWVLEWLGFAKAGPVAGTFASWWQARYAGYVPKRSLFSFFQRLGMVWKHGRQLKGLW